MGGKFRLVPWVDLSTYRLFWGVYLVPQGKRFSKGMPVAVNGKPLFFDTKAEARAWVNRENAHLMNEEAANHAG